MFFESDCTHCGGSGVKSVSMVDFLNAVIEGLSVNHEAANKIMAIKAVRQLASDNHLPAGLRDCKDFVEAIQTFERSLRGGRSRAYHQGIDGATDDMPEDREAFYNERAEEMP